MASLKDTALSYEPKVTLNIADLDRVDLSFPVEEREGRNKDGQVFTYKVMVVNGIEYRVPTSVVEEIKKMLKLKPELTHVRVKKLGSGLQTKYEVEPA